MAFEPTDKHRAQVEALVAFGIPEPDICTLIINPGTGKPIDAKTLRRHFRKELDDGLVRANIKVAARLYQAACNGQVASMIFWLKTRAGWRETNRTELANPDGSPLAPPSLEVVFVEAPPEPHP